MKELAVRAGIVAPSLTLAITAQANKLKAQGVDIVGFTAGEPDFRTPEYIVDAAKEALDKGFTKYTPASGTAELKKAVCSKLERENGLIYAPENIVISSGAKQSLYNVMQILLDEGDEVIIIKPYWLTYPEIIKLNGGVPVYVDTKAEKGFIPDINDIEKAVTSKTKAIIVNSPNNPTGAVYSEEEIRAVARLAQKYDLWIVSDEIYEKLVYDGKKHVSFASVSEDAKSRTFVVNGLSKAYAMTGWRIGYVAAPDAESAKAMGSIQSHETSNPNSVAQYASVAALGSEGDKVIDSMVRVFDERRKLMLSLLEGIKYIKPVAPSGAFYVMIDVSGIIGRSVNGEIITTPMQLSKVLIENANVAVIPGECFGANEYIRLSYSLSDDKIIEGIKRIKAFTEKIN